jgi:hypothetical protein
MHGLVEQIASAVSSALGPQIAENLLTTQGPTRSQSEESEEGQAVALSGSSCEATIVVL